MSVRLCRVSDIILSDLLLGLAEKLVYFMCNNIIQLFSQAGA